MGELNFDVWIWFVVLVPLAAVAGWVIGRRGGEHLRRPRAAGGKEGEGRLVAQGGVDGAGGNIHRASPVWGRYRRRRARLQAQDLPVAAEAVEGGMTDLSHLAQPGAEIALRVTPKASRNEIVAAEDGLRAYVTVVPEGGKANAAVVKLLAKALGVAKTRLTLIRGETARDKVFRLD